MIHSYRYRRNWGVLVMLLCMASGVLSATVEQNQLSGTTLVDRMINGNFSQHTPFKSKIHKFRSGDNNHRVDGWNYRSMKVGLGKHFNPNWDDNVTVALVPGMDKQISVQLSLQTHKVYKLSVDYSSAFGQTGGQIILCINSLAKLILNEVQAHAVHRATMYFMASPTMNDLTFSRNNYKNGLTITNIQVLEISDQEAATALINNDMFVEKSLVQNGDFRHPKPKESPQKYNYIQGWYGGIQMINAHEHNKNFPKGTRGILLSNLDNREVTQTVYNCNPGDQYDLVITTALQDGNRDSPFIVIWNQQIVHYEHRVKNYSIMTIRLRVTSFATNVITLSAKYPTSTMQGIIVTSVELHHVLSSMITFDVMKTVESQEDQVLERLEDGGKDKDNQKEIRPKNVDDDQALAISMLKKILKKEQDINKKKETVSTTIVGNTATVAGTTVSGTTPTTPIIAPTTDHIVPSVAVPLIASPTTKDHIVSLTVTPSLTSESVQTGQTASVPVIQTVPGTAPSAAKGHGGGGGSGGRGGIGGTHSSSSRH